MSGMSPDDEPLSTYRVGALYIPGQRSWPEGAEYNFRANSHELRLFWHDPSPREVESVRAGRARFALAVHGPIVFFLYTFEPALPWSDAPFTVWMVPSDQRTLPAPTQLAEPHAILQVVLVDADTGVVRALRVTTFSPSFTAALHLAIRAQHEAGWPGQDAYDRALDEVYRRYPQSASLLATATARTEGGR